MRLDLLAGVLWAHCHIKDLSSALADISIDQQRRLAAALRLDYDNDSKQDYWPDLVSRKILANALPGSTPLKRKAPDGALDGQIVKPGPDGAPAQPPQPGPPDSGSLLPLPPAAKASKPSKPAKRGAHRRARDSGDDSATSGSDEHASDDEAVVYEPGDSSSGLARMPSDLGSGPAFASLVASICALKWVPTHTFRSADVPAELRNSLWRAARWEPKHLERYDKMVARQNKPGRRNDRREDPSMVACPHRLCFAWSGDDGLSLDAAHLAMVCACESMSDWAGAAGKKYDGSAGRAAYAALLLELRTVWAEIRGAFTRVEHISASAITTLINRLETFLERRYTRFATVLATGPLREEVLANVARQLVELREYFVRFQSYLADRSGRRIYAEGGRARFENSYYEALFTPVVNFLLDEDSGTAFAAGGGGGAARTVTPPAARRSIMRSVAFVDEPAPEATPPRAAPTPQPSLMAGAGGWPPYAGGAPLYMPPYSMAPPAYLAPPHVASAWDGLLQSPPGQPRAPPAVGPSPPSLITPRLAAPPAAPRTLSVVQQEDPDRNGFLAQPQHEYVCGVGCAAVPSGEVRRPQCNCARRGGSTSYTPGLHATWDCPRRFIRQCGRCPGFRADGSRDPACWLGDHLTPETRSDWVKFLKEFPLPLPHGAEARSPKF